MLKINHINVPWKKESKRLKSSSVNEPSERHSNIEILYILSGERTIFYDDACYQASKGDVFFIQPNIKHSAYAGKCIYQQLWLWPGHRAVWGAIIARKDKQKKQTTVCRRSLEPSTYCPWVADLLQSGDENTLPREKLLGLSLLLISDFLNTNHVVSKSENEENLPDKQRGDIADICQYMEICNGAGLTVSKLAKMANYSPTHFARLFREHTGMTVHAKINQLRKKKMQEMEQMHCSVKMIATTLGFIRPSAFCTWRKKYSNSN